MTGKRPRALTRTASVSQLGSGSLSQEFSPLVENPKEKLKVCGGVVGARRVVIGFDPKPDVSPKSAPCSPCFNDDASSPRSVLGSLFSRQQRCVKPSEGVGLGIALQQVDHIAIPVRDDVVSPPKQREAVVAPQPRRHSHPIPTPGISACHFSRQEVKLPQQQQQQPVARPVPGWLEHHDSLKLDRRDTFLLGASPSRSLKDSSSSVAAALTTAASSHFLDECSFCKRHLPEDKDIFMYRGDKAFCSVECRSQQMLMDERSKNCASSAFKRTPGSATAPSQRSRVAPASSVAAA